MTTSMLWTPQFLQPKWNSIYQPNPQRQMWMSEWVSEWMHAGLIDRVRQVQSMTKDTELPQPFQTCNVNASIIIALTNASITIALMQFCSSWFPFKKQNWPTADFHFHVHVIQLSQKEELQPHIEIYPVTWSDKHIRSRQLRQGQKQNHGQSTPLSWARPDTQMNRQVLLFQQKQLNWPVCHHQHTAHQRGHLQANFTRITCFT